MNLSRIKDIFLFQPFEAIFASYFENIFQEMTHIAPKSGKKSNTPVNPSFTSFSSWVRNSPFLF